MYYSHIYEEKNSIDEKLNGNTRVEEASTAVLYRENWVAIRIAVGVSHYCICIQGSKDDETHNEKKICFAFYRVQIFFLPVIQCPCNF